MKLSQVAKPSTGLILSPTLRIRIRYAALMMVGIGIMLFAVAGSVSKRVVWDCLNFAEATSNPKTSASMLNLAQYWVRLAEGGERSRQHRSSQYRAKAWNDFIDLSSRKSDGRSDREVNFIANPELCAAMWKS